MTHLEFSLRDEFEAGTHPLHPPPIAWRLCEGESTAKKVLQGSFIDPLQHFFPPMIPSRTWRRGGRARVGWGCA